jgi:ribosomal protein S18 acetylase RimI-like enzyme
MQAARFKISAAEPRDIEDIVELFIAYESHIGVDLSYQNFATEVSTLPGKYAPPSGQLLIARDPAGSALGCVALRQLDATRCEMKRLFVSPNGRGLGLGRALAEAIIGEGKRLGYREMRLDTLPTMQHAIGLYRQLDFAPIDAYYFSARPGTIFMALDLTASNGGATG